MKIDFNVQAYAVREILSVIGSISIVLYLRFYPEVFSFIGVHSPKRTKEAFKKMGRRLLQSMGRLDSSRVILFRTSNGEAYIVGTPTTRTKIKVVFSYVNDGFLKMPSYEAQDRAFQVLMLLDQTEEIPEKIYYTNELKYDFLKSFLFEYDIRAFCVVKILSEDKTKLYGFCLYTWSDVRTIPNKSGSDRLRDREYVELLSIYIKEKFIEIIEYSFTERIKRISGKLKKIGHII